MGCSCNMRSEFIMRIGKLKCDCLEDLLCRTEISDLFAKEKRRPEPAFVSKLSTYFSCDRGFPCTCATVKQQDLRLVKGFGPFTKVGDDSCPGPFNIARFANHVVSHINSRKRTQVCIDRRQLFCTSTENLDSLIPSSYLSSLKSFIF